MKTQCSIPFLALVILFLFLMITCSENPGKIGVSVVWRAPVPPCGDDYPPDTCLIASLYNSMGEFVTMNYIVIGGDDYPPDTINIEFSDLTLGAYLVALERIDEEYLTSHGKYGQKEVLSWYTGTIETLAVAPDKAQAMWIELTPEQEARDRLIMEIH